ncbi:hypothetical protein RI129_006668 [Pyrocoelia pectoralis]|uniref:C2H2-type domain-containing protein n=1 Tax=Pyrocoelia pectoralis TaxID=417401 RepID=A0AAN7ZP32_9COLE
MLFNSSLIDDSESLNYTLNDAYSLQSARYVSSATEEESVAVEALRQLGSTLINTKIAKDLSLLSCDADSTICGGFYEQSQSPEIENDETSEEVRTMDECMIPVLCNTWDNYELIQDDDFNNVAQELIIETCTGDSNEIKDLELCSINGSCNPESEIKSKTCNICSRSFARETAFLSHLKLHSQLNSDGSLSDDEESVKDENFEKNKKICCSLCKKCFPTKQKLQRHMWVHRKKKFSCEICAMCFERQVELDEHRLSSHQATATYFCCECGKCFFSRQGLWEHNRIHGSSTKSYKCVECDKTFASRQGYLIHKRTHSDERPFKCKFCWKAFRDGGTLRKHERIHTGERPHECPLCLRAFNQKVVLREHVRWLHTANWQPTRNDSFKCSLCDIVLMDRDDLCAHIVKHSDTNALRLKNKYTTNETQLTSDVTKNE